MVQAISSATYCPTLSGLPAQVVRLAPINCGTSKTPALALHAFGRRQLWFRRLDPEEEAMAKPMLMRIVVVAAAFFGYGAPKASRRPMESTSSPRDGSTCRAGRRHDRGMLPARPPWSPSLCLVGPPDRGSSRLAPAPQPTDRGCPTATEKCGESSRGFLNSRCSKPLSSRSARISSGA
jgi:hypothetical protein